MGRVAASPHAYAAEAPAGAAAAPRPRMPPPPQRLTPGRPLLRPLGNCRVDRKEDVNRGSGRVRFRVIERGTDKKRQNGKGRERMERLDKGQSNKGLNTGRNWEDLNTRQQEGWNSEQSWKRLNTGDEWKVRHTRQDKESL